MNRITGITTLIAGAVIAATLLPVSTSQAAKPGAGGSSDPCPNVIPAVPYTISSQGVYCLAQSFSLNSVANAIVINADDVTLDMRGYGIANNSGNSTPKGISVLGQGVEIKNGTLKGFSIGVEGLVQNVNVSGMHVINSTVSGINISHNGSVVNNIIEGVVSNDQVTGIYTDYFSVVQGNIVRNISSAGNTAYGIISNGTVVENTVVDVSDNNHGTGVGIDCMQGGSIVNNVVTNTSSGVQTEHTSCEFGRNVVTNSPSKYTGIGTDLGGNL